MDSPAAGMLPLLVKALKKTRVTLEMSHKTRFGILVQVAVEVGYDVYPFRSCRIQLLDQGERFHNIPSLGRIEQIQQDQPIEVFQYICCSDDGSQRAHRLQLLLNGIGHPPRII